ncbi:MAG: glycosyltransferase, partial [Candidatus Tectomicrobia bacterium]|nr:glycosyltransferase [Candidatus Tectomicrobia bacterium]
MKVLHVIPAVAPRYGGPSRAVIEMCGALKEREVESLIATTDADGTSRLPVDLERPVLYEGVPTIFFSRQWSEAFKYSHPLARWLDANAEGFDVAHIHAVFSHACLAAARACRRYGVPYVVRPLGTLDPWSLRQKRFRKRLLWHFGVKKMLRGAAEIHYTTAAERRLAEGVLGLRRGIVIPLGVNQELIRAAVVPDSFRPRYPTLEKDPYVLVLSRLHPKKGLDLFLEVFLEVTRRGEFQDWRSVVAGDGDPGYVAGLKGRVQELGGNGRVVFTGWLHGAEKVAALQGAELLALPSHQENFGLSVVEALACGVPVVVGTPVNLSEEIQAAGAGWVVPLERAALADVLGEVLRDEQERQRRGAAGRKMVLSRFTWPRVASQLVELYGSL